LLDSVGWQVLQIDTVNEEVVTFGESFDTEKNKWQNGFCTAQVNALIQVALTQLPNAILTQF
jgi:hypothetical protein